MRDLALLGGDLATRCLCPFIVIARFCAAKSWQSVASLENKRSEVSLENKRSEVSLVIHRIKPPRIHF
ncbi:hypothetical protein NYG90_02940 [Helicobacter sp. XJK30-2]|uniref:Uncharacterized protein n=1 Tax=Helicobacter zhangjianzhongii TaxID=2974574 RepID=A0ACC6FR02_9HELI|nr:hypothetical protein [Helicobacter sp. XJK30-2]MDL0081641.1 hypothetical protein [Helicobacter sp. XJK30-2]